MVAAAERGALPAIDAFLAGIDLEPQFIDEARDGGALGAEIGDPPGMDHILRGQQQPHLGAARDDQRIVDLQQIVGHRLRIDAGMQLAREIRIARQRREEIDALAPHPCTDTATSTDSR